MDVGENKIVEQLLDHRVVVLHVGRDDVVRLRDDGGKVVLREESEHLLLLRRVDVLEVLDAKHEHDGHDGSLHLGEVF